MKTKSATAMRIDTAVRTILSGRNTTRTFDNCFENHDSRQVAAGVWARALRNPKIMTALPSYLVTDACKADYDSLRAKT